MSKSLFAVSLLAVVALAASLRNTVPHTLLMISNKGVPRTARFGGS
jgi:hypothetical protein